LSRALSVRFIGAPVGSRILRTCSPSAVAPDVPRRRRRGRGPATPDALVELSACSDILLPSSPCPLPQVKSIAEMGAYVSLLEYDNKEGMILLSELSRRRIRSIAKLIKVGRVEPVMCLRVDEEKGYIDLSKRRVSPEEAAAAEDRYARSRLVATLIGHVADVCGVDLLELNKRLTWPLYKEHGHAYDALRQAAVDPDAILGKYNLEPALRDRLIKDVKQRLKPHPHKVRADVELRCHTFAGVDGIKAAMRAAAACSTDDCPIEVRLIAAPVYVLTTMTHDKRGGLEALARAIEAARAALEAPELGGDLAVRERPRVVSAEDEKLLAERMAELELANAEIDGDDSGSGDEDEAGMGSGKVEGEE